MPYYLYTINIILLNNDQNRICIWNKSARLNWNISFNFKKEVPDERQDQYTTLNCLLSEWRPWWDCHGYNLEPFSRHLLLCSMRWVQQDHWRQSINLLRKQTTAPIKFPFPFLIFFVLIQLPICRIIWLGGCQGIWLNDPWALLICHTIQTNAVFR